MEAITISKFKSQFSRDFTFGITSDKVTNSDITKAINESQFFLNDSLFETQAEYDIAAGYIAAHCLVTNLKNSSQGLNGQFSWLENSKSIGSVSQSFTIPDDILKNTHYAMVAKTIYGAKYLSLVIPMLRGAMYSCTGTTQP